MLQALHIRGPKMLKSMLVWAMRTAGENISVLNRTVFQSQAFYHGIFLMGGFFTNSSFESIYNTFLYMLPCYFLKSSIYTEKVSSEILLYQESFSSQLRTYSAKLPQHVIYHGISLAHFEKK